ncbi:MAG: rRNA maturation RNase YbeY [Bacteroidetes bacterium]|nr:rRNA maturation RNase YbeY [Bacteroidota bacterium]
MSFPIQFFSEDIRFTLKNRSVIRKWLTTVIRAENKNPWYVNFIFCSDEYLFELNKTYLHHLTLTDIITFPYNDDPETVSGDIFISIERVRENAKEFKQEFDRELKRVMVHGVLHLIGYSDKGKKHKEAMTAKEDHYLDIA